MGIGKFRQGVFDRNPREPLSGSESAPGVPLLSPEEAATVAGEHDRRLSSEALPVSVSVEKTVGGSKPELK